MIKNRFFSKNHCRNCLSGFCIGTTVLLFASYFVSCGFASSVGSDYYLDNANNETGVEDFINPDEADESGDKFEEIIFAFSGHLFRINNHLNRLFHHLC